MFPFAQLLVSALIATSVIAAPAASQPGTIIRPIVTQEVSKVFNPDDMTALVKADHLRAQSARSGTLAGDLSGGGMSSFAKFASNGTVSSAHATNQAVYYTTAVQIGNPTRNYQLILDTGSANTWVGVKTPYTKTTTSTSTGAKMTVNYQAAQMQGLLYYDQVALSSSLKVTGQAIGVATSQRGFDGSDGVLGLGPKRLSRGTTSQGTSVEYPTFSDTLFSKGVTAANVVSLSFAPANAVGVINGQVTFGGTDSTRYNSKLTYVPVTKTYPASSYWGADVASVGYGTTQLFTKATPAIVESGLTLVYLASDAFAKYQKATGAVMDSTTGLLKITAAQYKALKPLDFTIGGTKFSLTPNAQIWSRALNKAIKGDVNSIYLSVANLGSNSGSGLDIILGQAFMERFYITYDAGKAQIGFATTENTNSTMH